MPIKHTRGALRTLAPAACVSLLLLGACSAASSSAPVGSAGTSMAALDIHPWSPPPGQSCTAVRPDSLPTIGAAFDSTALAAAARRVTASGALLVRVSTDSLGFPTVVRRIDTSLPEAEAELLEDSVRVYFRGGRGVHARVRVDTRAEGEPRFRVAPTQECRPTLRNRRQIREFLEDANARAERAGTVMLWVFVREDGSVANVRIVEESGYEFLDAVSVGIATRMQFNPALLDREPVPVWIQIPFSLRLSNFSAPPIR